MRLSVGRTRGDRLRSLLRKAVLGGGAVLLALLLSYSAFRRWTLLAPPSDDGPPLPKRVKSRSSDAGVQLAVGESWAERRGNVWRVKLDGDPRAIGNAHGLLLGRMLQRFEASMLRFARRHGAHVWERWSVSNRLRWELRSLPSSIPPRRQVELAALARTIVDIDDLAEQPFARLTYAQALFEAFDLFDQIELPRSNAFAVWGKRTTGARLVVGRSIDPPAALAQDFHPQKAVMIVRERGCHCLPYVSVGWPGLAGVILGVNSERLLVSASWVRSDQGVASGIPASMLAREVLQHARSLKQAVAIVKRSTPMAPFTLLVADGGRGAAAVVEVTPERSVVRRARDQSIAVTDHFMHTKFRGDAENDRTRRYTSSNARLLRMRELIDRFSGRFDAETAALVLRNRTGLKDAPLALGHRSAIDALRSVYGVIVDLGQMVLWVARGPHLLGAFEPIDLKPLFDIPAKSAPPEPIASDGLLGSPRLQRFELARAQMAHARRLLRRRRLQRARDYASRAVEGAPQLPAAHRLMGDVLWALGQRDKAREHYRLFLKLKPARRRIAERVESRLAG